MKQHTLASLLLFPVINYFLPLPGMIVIIVTWLPAHHVYFLQHCTCPDTRFFQLFHPALEKVAHATDQIQSQLMLTLIDGAGGISRRFSEKLQFMSDVMEDVALGDAHCCTLPFH